MITFNGHIYLVSYNGHEWAVEDESTAQALWDELQGREQDMRNMQEYVPE